VCGRFGFLDNLQGLAEIYPGLVGDEEQVLRGRNLPPGEPRTVVVGTDDGPRLSTPVWGLQLAGLRRALINVRVEGAASHGLFGPLLMQHRCAVPASFFFEWMKPSPSFATASRPYLVMSRSLPLSLAAIMASSQPGERPSFAILTTQARGFLQQIHHRVPLLLRPEDLDAWLDPQVNTPDQLRQLVKPYPISDLVAHEVGPEVNDPRNQGGGMLAAVGAELGAPPSSEGAPGRGGVRLAQAGFEK
jgi:putative SOS response-associated peptidase YedK